METVSCPLSILNASLCVQIIVLSLIGGCVFKLFSYLRVLGFDFW